MATVRNFERLSEEHDHQEKELVLARSKNSRLKAERNDAFVRMGKVLAGA